MHQLHVKNRYRTGLKLDALTYDERSQDVILDKGVPIISKVNNEEMGLINNQRFKIIKLDVFNITIEDDIGNKKDIKFIISEYFCQLKPVNDRIPYNTDYANSPCLFELADYNKIQLTKCRRADDTLYNLIKFDNIPNLKPSDFNETDKYNNDINICFTNNKRKEINQIKCNNCIINILDMD